jgi:hypothetical protein
VITRVSQLFGFAPLSFHRPGSDEQNTTLCTALAPDRFKSFWRD